MNIPLAEHQALLSLHSNCNGAGWYEKWNINNLDIPFYGVEVSVIDGTPHITNIKLDANNLRGQIPPAISSLTCLTQLDLSFNILSGTIPASIANLNNLILLYLNNNKLTGNIPSEFENLKKLRFFDISNNLLTGNLSAALPKMQALSSLILNNNKFTGPLMPELFSLPELQSLYLYSNQLNGTIPLEIGNLAKIDGLALDSNAFTGPIPYTIGKLTKIRGISFANNKLTGKIPKEIGNMTALCALGLNKNELSDSIPIELNKLKELYYIDLSNNNLTGTLHNKIDQLFNLRILYIHDTKISGTIPLNIGKMIKLYYLNLSSNKLTGIIPPGLNTIDRLLEVNLSNNELSGIIPNFSLCLKLNVFKLDHNNFKKMEKGFHAEAPLADLSLSHMRTIEGAVDLNIPGNEILINLPNFTGFQWKENTVILNNFEGMYTYQLFKNSITTQPIGTFQANNQNQVLIGKDIFSNFTTKDTIILVQREGLSMNSIIKYPISSVINDSNPLSDNSEKVSIQVSDKQIIISCVDEGNKISIYSLNGILMKSVENKSKRTVIGMEFEGVYIVKVTSGKSTITRKVII